jgi:hypothetical protein
VTTHTYQSKTDDSPGSPMMLVSYRVHRYPSWYPLKSFIRKARHFNQSERHVYVDLSDVRLCDLAKVLSRGDLSERAKTFNISPDTAKALKAHYNRGTYAKEFEGPERSTTAEKLEQLETFMAMESPTIKSLESLDVFHFVRELARRTFEAFPRLTDKDQHIAETMRYSIYHALGSHCDFNRRKWSDRDVYVQRLLEVWTGTSLGAGARGKTTLRARAISLSRHSGHKQGPAVHRQTGHLTV